MLIIGYCMGIRSERRLCEEVHVNLAYRWFGRHAPSIRQGHQHAQHASTSARQHRATKT